MILHNLCLITLLCLNNCFLRAEPVECQEDVYMMQAPEQIVECVEQVAQLVDFTLPYEVVIPKKAAIKINPWNSYITHSINPQTGRPLIIVNPEWFNQLSKDEQIFFFACCFEALQERASVMAWATKSVPFIHMALSLLLIVGSYVTIRKTQIITQRALAAAVAYGSVLLLNLTVLNGLQTKLVSYMNAHHSTIVRNKAIERTGNKDAAIRALIHFDEAIKKEAAQGDPFWQPFVNICEAGIQELQGAQ